jgi:hypothetical protein
METTTKDRLEQEDALRVALSRARAEVAVLLLAIRKSCAMTARTNLEAYCTRHLRLHGRPATIAGICRALRISERYLRRVLSGDADPDSRTVERVLGFLESDTAPLPARRPGRPQRNQGEVFVRPFPAENTALPLEPR